MESEVKILHALAVIGLAAALITAGFIAVSSGVLGGGKNSSGGAGQSLSSTTPAASSGAAAPAGSDSSTGAGHSTETTAAAGTTYVVQDGDTFFSIARKFNTTIADIQKLNPNVDPQHLTAGIKLTVPQQ